MSEKTYTVIHLYMGEVCKSDRQSYHKVLKTLSHLRDNQVKGWSSKEAFLESLAKFMKVAQPGESYMIGDLGAVIRERPQNEQVAYLIENNWSFEGEDESDAYLEESIDQSIWIESGVLIGHDEVEDEPISGDVLVIGDGNFEETVNVPLCLIRDLIERKDQKEDPSAQ